MGISLCYKHMMVLAGRPLRSSKQRHRKHGPVQELPQLNALSKVCQAREQLDDSCRSTTGPQQRLKSTEKLGSELWPFTLRDTRAKDSHQDHTSERSKGSSVQFDLVKRVLYVLRISSELFQKGTATATNELTLSQCLHAVYIVEHMAHGYLRALTEQFL